MAEKRPIGQQHPKRKRQKAALRKKEQGQSKGETEMSTQGSVAREGTSVKSPDDVAILVCVEIVAKNPANEKAAVSGLSDTHIHPTGAGDAGVGSIAMPGSGEELAGEPVAPSLDSL